MSNGGFTYANGMNKHSAEKIAIFIFGGFFRELKKNDEDRMFDIILNEHIEGDNNERKYFKDEFTESYITYFKEFWGKVPGFRLKIVEVIVKEEDFL